MKRAYRLLLSYALIFYTGLFCLIGVLGYATYEIATESAVEESAQAWLVDSAGRQRMLAQRLAKEFALLSMVANPEQQARWQDAALDTAEQLLEGHAAVRAHGHPSGEESAAHKEADQIFRELQPVLSSIAYLRATLATSNRTRPVDDQELARVLSATEHYVALMDRVVALLARENAQIIAQIRSVLIYGAAPLLCVLLVGTLLFFWPLVRRLRTSHDALEAANRQLRDEVLGRQRLAKVVEQSADGILICDASARIEYVNPAFEDMTGWRSEDVIGRTPAFLRSGSTPESVYQEMWRTIQEGRPWRGEMTDLRQDGSTFEVSLGITPILEQGTLQGYVGMTRDVTHERELEDQLRRAQKLEAIGALAGGIAHDFNNILTPIMGYTELALRNHAPDTKDHAGLTRVLSAARRARDLVRQILAFSRQGEPRQEPVHLAGLMDEVVQLLHSTMPTNVTLDVHADPGLDPALGDASQLHTVLLNLCVNALQAMPDGGRLSLAVSRAQANAPGAPATLPPGCGLLCLSVRDTGVGMSEETQERIFDPFFTTKPVGKGTGLGLSAVYGIVTQHGGGVYVQSQPGQGTEFRVYLPSRPAVRVEHPVAPKERPAGASGRILLAEDESDIAQLAARALTDGGHQVRVARDGAEAWRLFQADPDAFDLVITDLSMPNLSGRDLLAHVHHLRPHLPVILVSGYDSELPSAIPPRDGHASPRFLAKPYSLDTLSRMVAEQLRR